MSLLAGRDEFLELVDGPDVKIDLRYASLNNFVGINMYGEFNRAYLHKIAFEKLFRALAFVRETHPHHRFIIFDALRPRSIQRILWKHVVGTVNQQYIGDPDLGGMHNYGFAVDLSLLDGDGLELDMGAGFDDFREISQPKFEPRFLVTGELTSVQHANRMLLRKAMERAGFIQLPHEWWHFDAAPRDEVRAKYKIVD